MTPDETRYLIGLVFLTAGAAATALAFPGSAVGVAGWIAAGASTAATIGTFAVLLVRSRRRCTGIDAGPVPGLDATIGSLHDRLAGRADGADDLEAALDELRAGARAGVDRSTGG